MKETGPHLSLLKCKVSNTNVWHEDCSIRETDNITFSQTFYLCDARFRFSFMSLKVSLMARSERFISNFIVFFQDLCSKVGSDI